MHIGWFIIPRWLGQSIILCASAANPKRNASHAMTPGTFVGYSLSKRRNSLRTKCAPASDARQQWSGASFSPKLIRKSWPYSDSSTRPDCHTCARCYARPPPDFHTSCTAPSVAVLASLAASAAISATMSSSRSFSSPKSAQRAWKGVGWQGLER